MPSNANMSPHSGERTVSLLSLMVCARFVDGLTKQHDAKEAEMNDALKRLKERGSELVESSILVYYCL